MNTHEQLKEFTVVVSEMDDFASIERSSTRKIS